MKKLMAVLFTLFAAMVSSAEIKEIHVRDKGGIFNAFMDYERVELNDDGELEFTAYETKYYLKAKEYPVPLGSHEGVHFEARTFTLKHGESLIWGGAYCDANGTFVPTHGGWGCLSYISGKDLPASIECPKVYREADHIVHFVHRGNGRWEANVLFDPVRNKQFNLVNPEEYDVWFLPCPRKARDGGWETYVRSVYELQFRVCEVAKEKLAGCDQPDPSVDFRLLRFPCEVGVRALVNYIPGYTEEQLIAEGFTSHWDRVIFGFPPPVPKGNVFTNILVAARRKGDGWQATGVVTLPEFHAPRAYLLDDDGRLMMSDAFDVDHDQHRTWYDIPHRDNREDVLIVYDRNGQIVPLGQPMQEAFERRKREFEEKRNAAFNWTGEFTLERLLQRVKEDEERIRKAREE